MNIGVNFFGPKRRLYHDFEGTLATLKAAGISSAEVCVAFAGGGEPPKELALKIPPEVLREMKGGIWDVDVAAERIAAVRACGLTVISAHVMLGTLSDPQQLLDLLPELVRFGRENEITYFVLSPMKDASQIVPFLPALRELSDALHSEGMALALHNHEMECIPVDGVTALDCILEQCPNLKLELDVGWAKFAGADPVALMRKYRDRLELLHFKDIRADACPENRDSCFTAVGAGSIPLREIMAEAKFCPIAEHGLIIDQDDSPTDILSDLAEGACQIRRAAE